MKKTSKNAVSSSFRRAILSGALAVLFGAIAAAALWGGYHSRPQISHAAATPPPVTSTVSQVEEPRTAGNAAHPEPTPSTAEIEPRVSPSEQPATQTPESPVAEGPASDRDTSDAPLLTGTGPVSPPAEAAGQAAGELSWKPLVKRLAEDGFDAARMEALFASLESPPLRQFMGQKCLELYGRRGKASLNVSDEEKNSSPRRITPGSRAA